jgi:hypothetical protein
MNMIEIHSSDGGGEVRPAKTGNMPVSQPGEETERPLPGSCGRFVQGAATQPCAGVTPGPSEAFRYRYAWNRMGRKGQACAVLARGKMNSCLVQFEDGFTAVTSRNALRRRKVEDCQ